MNKLPWFTHDNDALEDEWVQEMIRSRGFEAYGRWWALIEKFDRHGSGDNWATSMGFLREKLKLRSTGVEQLLNYFQTSGKVLIVIDGEKVNISIPKFRERNAKLKSKARAKLPEDSSKTLQDKEKEEDRDKEKETPIAPSPKKVSKPEEPPAMFFPCVGGDHIWNLTHKKLNEYEKSFPGVQMLPELMKANQWLRDNPTRQKTAKGMPRFLGAWLGRVQDKGRSAGPQVIGSKSGVDLDSKYGGLEE